MIILNKFRNGIARYLLFYLFILPSLVYFIVFVVYPLAQGAIMSFQKYGLMGARGWAGFENYMKLIKDAYFYQTVWNTLEITFGITLFSVVIPIAFAVALDATLFKTFRKIIQTSIYVPYLFSALIVVGIFINLFSPIGPFNTFMISMGLTSKPFPFFTGEFISQCTLVFMVVWKDVGYNTLIYLAALTTINPALYEAADIDGASFMQKVFNVTVPGISHTIKIVLLITLMGALRTFDMAYVMLNSTNYKSVTTAIIYTYEKGILKYDMGLATAAAGVIFVLTLLIVFIVKKIIKYE